MPTTGNSLYDQLRLQEPVDINGPFPTLLRTADLGDLIQLQIFTVPGIFPRPVSVRVYSHSGLLVLIEAVATGGAVYHPAPGHTVTGVLGTDHYSIFVRAVRRGNDSLTVEVRLADGSLKCVPFAFLIS